MSGRLIAAAVAAIVVFAGAAYGLGRMIKQSNEPPASATPVHIVSEEATVRGTDGGPAIPALRTPRPTRTPQGTTTAATTTGPTTTGPTTTGPTTTGPTTTGPTTTGPTTTGPTTTGPTTTGPTTTGPTTTGPTTTGPTTTGPTTTTTD